MGLSASIPETKGQGVEVSTPLGRLRGLRVQGHHRFLGIPYAEAPVGELRFKDTVPVKSWEGIKDATRFGSKCLQVKETSHDTKEK